MNDWTLAGTVLWLLCNFALVAASLAWLTWDDGRTPPGAVLLLCVGMLSWACLIAFCLVRMGAVGA